jgi:hypothetical protein
MRHHKNLQFLTIPFVPFVAHSPPLLPRPTILIQELDSIIQTLCGYIHSSPTSSIFLPVEVIAAVSVAVVILGWLSIPDPVIRRRLGFKRRGEEGFWDAKEEDGNQKEAERD